MSTFIGYHHTLCEYLYELRLMAAFRERINNYVRMGAIAERAIAEREIEREIEKEIEKEMSENGE